MSAKKLTDNEVELLSRELDEFTTAWNAHGKKLDSQFEIRYNHFIILKADEARITASGCSIDDSVRFMTKLAEKYKIDIFDRQLVGWLGADNEVRICKFNEIHSLYQNNILTDGTIIFNNSVHYIDDLSEKWMKPLKESLYMRFI